MPSKKIEKIPVSDEKRQWFIDLIATHPEIEPKGKNMLYTSVNGHMFTVFSSSAMYGIRLPKEEREKFIEKYNTGLLPSHGAVMREYVCVPDDLLPKTEELKPYLEMSYNYVKSLKPKPTTKKRK